LQLALDQPIPTLSKQLLSGAQHNFTLLVLPLDRSDANLLLGCVADNSQFATNPDELSRPQANVGSGVTRKPQYCVLVAG